jgi:hypothetical protein
MTYWVGMLFCELMPLCKASQYNGKWNNFFPHYIAITLSITLLLVHDPTNI